MSRRTTRGAKRTQRGKPGARPGPERRELHIEALRDIVERARSRPLDAEQAGTLSAALETLGAISAELEQAGTTIARLRKLLFGSSSEKRRNVLGKAGKARAAAAADANAEPVTEEHAQASHDVQALLGEDASNDARGATRRRGHGRNGATAYAGAERVKLDHDTLSHRDPCPECERGKVYRQHTPRTLVRVRGMAPLSATVYALERLRCNLCETLFTAAPPPGVGTAKYDETAAAMIALLKYGCGLPFNRMQRLGANLNMPLPATTQWDVVAKAAEAFEPLWATLIERAAGAEVVHIDDTHAKVLALNETIREELARGESTRTGIFTSGVVATTHGAHRVVLFFTGRAHAGENLDKVLAQRASGLPPPIQMADALSRNTAPGTFETLVANCMSHGRRNFVDVVNHFPEQVAHVLETVGEVYHHDAEARRLELSPEQRLRYHQTHSAPLMEALAKWLQAQFDERRVEPNSSLGGAIRYMQNHWDALTLFLRVPGAPLDNNITERALKRAILHRKNSLFYKTENGAHVGDVFMSLIHTAELCKANPFDYLVAVQKHREAVAEAPEQWMPWNYQAALE